MEAVAVVDRPIPKTRARGLRRWRRTRPLTVNMIQVMAMLLSLTVCCVIYVRARATALHERYLLEEAQREQERIQMENRTLRHKAKRAGDFEFVRNQMKQIRPVDLRMVDICDFVVCNLDSEVHACGTYEELYWANRMKKPIIVRTSQGIEHTPDWLFGTLPFEMIFSTWDQVKVYLRHIAHDPVIDRLNRWYFFNWMGEGGKVEPIKPSKPARQRKRK